jgi:AraC-like DNA-binding protein
VLQGTTPQLYPYRLLPDGNPGIVFHFNNSSFVYGPITGYRHLVAPGNFHAFTVVLQPYGLPALLGIPPAALRNQAISLYDAFGTEAVYLEEQVNLLRHYKDCITVVERFLLRRLQSLPAPVKLAATAVQFIYRQKGIAGVAALTAQLQVSERQLQRSFADSIGISPQQFANIVRLQSFLKLLQRNQGQQNFTQLAYDAGYYDQAHLIREFRKFAGITPSAYLFQTKQLALNFIQFTKQ